MIEDNREVMLKVGDKVVVSTRHVCASGATGGGTRIPRDVKQGKVVGFNSNTIQVYFRDGTYSPAVRPRSIVKTGTFVQPLRSRKVLISLGTNLVEARVTNTTKERVNVEYNGKRFQFGKHKVIKIASTT